MSDIDSQQSQEKSDSGPTQATSSNNKYGKKGNSSTEPNTGTGDPTDGRKQYFWNSEYPPQARSEIRCEALFLFFILFISNFLIFATWRGWVDSIFNLSPKQIIILRQYAYYSSAGILGGVTFGIKYFYRVVARGYWHQDRRCWRLLSPFIASTIAFIVGAMVDSTLIATRIKMSGSAFISIGFLTGYFADNAVAKMSEIANVLFGRSVSTKAGDGK